MIRSASRDFAPRQDNRFPVDDAVASASDELFRSPHGKRLSSSIDALYEAFAAEKLSDTFDFCPHCFTTADVAYLRTTALRSLGVHDAAFILARAVSTLGSAADLNYFLPRILETWAYRGHYMEHVIPDKLRAAREAGWSPAQVAAVTGFLEVTFDAIDSLEDNSLWYQAVMPLVSELKIVVPEAAEAMRISLRAHRQSPRPALKGEESSQQFCVPDPQTEQLTK